MQILNELMKIKNAPGKGVRLISKTSCPPLKTVSGGPERPRIHDRVDSRKTLAIVCYRFNSVTQPDLQRRNFTDCEAESVGEPIERGRHREGPGLR